MHRVLVALLGAALTACAASSSVPTPAAPDTTRDTVAAVDPGAGAPAAASPAPAPKSGLDLAGFDTKVRPQDDLYRFAGGAWLEKTAIPEDRANYGTFSRLEDDALSALRALVEEAAMLPGRAYGSDAQKVGDFYASFIDVDRAAVLGATPLAAEIAQILAIRGPRDVFAYMGRSQRLGVPQPLLFYVTQDARDSKAYIAAVYQGGLTMPERDYYLALDARYVELRRALDAYAARLLALAGEPEADAAARRVTALEGRLANHHWTKARNRDPVKTYNKVSLADAPKMTPGFDWFAFLEGAGAPAVAALDVNQPTYVRELARLVRGTPVADWRLYFKFRLLDAYAPYLAPAFDRANFEFRELALRGTPAPPPRWQRGVRLLDGTIGELLGRLYVERHFTPQSRARIVALVGNLTRAFDSSIETLEWMSPATRAEARRKLARVTVKIGHPDRWRDYGRLEIRAGDLAGNVRRAREHEFARQLGRLGKPIDRDEWLLTPQTVNAYYNPPMNEIVFPAAILQPPFFDPAADDAVNYGAIGGVIGHEISHGFDAQGRQFDGDGNLRDWWTLDDVARFTERAGRLVAQFGSFKALDARALDGQLTLGENVGDLAGLTVAHKAYRLSLNGAQAPVIDGFTGPQRFFLGWAQVWRRKYRDDELRMRLLTDPHSPGEYRVNGIVANMTEFHEAFALTAADRLYRAPGDRVKIW